MTYRPFAVAVITLFLVVVGTGSWAGDLKHISEGSITVSYPNGMQAQAKRVMAIAKESIQPSVDIHTQVIKLLANTDSIATDIATLLGCEEKQDEARNRLDIYKSKSKALLAVFSNIHLMKKSEVAASSGVDAGLVQIRYDDRTDEFNLLITLDQISPDKIKLSYLPVLVNEDGTIRGENKIADMAIGYMGSTKALLVAPVHETVGYIMAEQLNLYHPFARWFNEGVSGWVTRHVVVKADSRLVSLANEILMVGEGSKRLSDKLNLLSWPQSAFQNFHSSDFDLKLETARTQYSVKIISDLLDTNGTSVLARIMKEINFNANADTATICSAIKKVTGKDLRDVLLAYVPSDVREGIKQNAAEGLVKRAEELVAEDRPKDAADRLRKALQMNPQDVNARLNLAWLERELGNDLDAEIQVFIVGRLLSDGKYSFHLYGESVDGNYVLGRLAILMGNLEYAKKLLQPVLDADPNHADAIRAMAEIETLENSMGGPRN